MMRLTLAKKFMASVGFVLLALFSIDAAWLFCMQRDALEIFFRSSNTVIDKMLEEQNAESMNSDNVKAKQITRLLAEIAPSQIAAFELTNLQRFAEVAADDPDISYVEFRHAEGQSLAVAGEKNAEDKYFETEISYEGTMLGRVVLGCNHQRTIANVDKVRKRTEIRLKELNEIKNTSMRNLGITLCIGSFLYLIIALVVLRFLIRSVTLPIKKMADFMEKVANGDLTDTIDIHSGDEIGMMGEAVREMLDSLVIILLELIHGAEDLWKASGELETLSSQMASSTEKMNLQADTAADASEQVTANVDRMASTTKDVSVSISDIAAMTEEMSATFNQVSDLARKTADNVNRMAASSEDISSGTRRVALSVEQSTISLSEIAKNTEQANRISRNASMRTREINAKAEALVRASKQIGKVVEVIKDIADQTNMLALNATIEAAGAGKAGRGFAVVAGEIKALAKESAVSTDEIEGQIEQIRTSTRDVADAICEISEIINEIAGINEMNASAVEEQTAIANEISKSVAASASNVKNVADDAGESANLVDEIARAANEASKTASDVAHNIDDLAQSVDDLAGSSGETAQVVQDISKNMQSIRTASEETVAGATRTNSASKDLAQMAAELSEIVNRFKL